MGEAKRRGSFAERQEQARSPERVQPPEKVLYKYLRREHADALLTHGVLRVGTLHEYRDASNHGGTVLDTQEGKRTVTLTGNGEHYTHDYAPPIVRRTFVIAPNASVTFSGGGIVDLQDASDRYLYCVTREYDEKAHARFHQADGYDACVVIEQPSKFFEAIGRALPDAQFVGAMPCDYTGRVIDHRQDNEMPPELVKNPEYAHQKETRAIYQPNHTKPIKPKILTVSDVTMYCRMHKIR